MGGIVTRTIVLCLFVLLGVSGQSVAVAAAGSSEQDIAKGERLLKNKQHAEPGVAVEADLLKLPATMSDPRYRSVLVSYQATPGGSARSGSQTNSLDQQMVLIPAGKFTRGSNHGDDEQPVRTIYLNAFYMDMFEVTVGQYARYLEATDMEEPPDWSIMNQPQHQRRPVVNVDWDDAVNYCKWAGKRLPTEAEWEKAARGTDGRIYPWGNEAPTRLHANYGRKDWDNHQALTPVGSFEAGKSPYGIYDMAGNAWEWVFDWYGNEFYRKGPERNPIGPAKGDTKVVRGGSWLYVPEFLRTSFRFNADPFGKQFGYGFRCAKTP